MFAKIEIEKVDNGYIVKKHVYGTAKSEIKVYENFFEMINWIAQLFNEMPIVKINIEDKEK